MFGAVLAILSFESAQIFTSSLTEIFTTVIGQFHFNSYFDAIRGGVLT